MTLPEIALVALAVLNIVTFLTFGFDKARARKRGASRVPERTLLLLALVGGTPGAYAGRSAFDHKTRKQPFVMQLHAVAVLQATALMLLAFWLGRSG